MNETPSSPDRASPNRADRIQLSDHMCQLTDTIRELRSEKEALEKEREQLLKENRRLRREVTQSRLINDLEDAVDAEGGGTQAPRPAPETADRLYQRLPCSFSFPVFFRIAENESLDTEAARRCLLHFLDEGWITQAGSRLAKQSSEQMGDGRRSSVEP